MDIDPSHLIRNLQYMYIQYLKFSYKGIRLVSYILLLLTFFCLFLQPLDIFL